MHPRIRQGWEEMLHRLERGGAIIMAGGERYGIPDLHTFYPKRYYKSIEHCGFGFFEGNTEHGAFSFDGGGAMRHFQGEGEWLSYSPLRASPEVLKDLGYDIEKVKAAVKEIIDHPPLFPFFLQVKLDS